MNEFCFFPTQAGSTRNRGGSAPKYLGIKMSHGQLAFPGQIILRQRGHKFHPGYHVGVGRDQTLFATTVGFIRFKARCWLAYCVLREPIRRLPPLLPELTFTTMLARLFHHVFLLQSKHIIKP